MSMPAEEKGPLPETEGRGRVKRFLVAGLGALILAQVALIAHDPQSPDHELARTALQFIELGDTLGADPRTAERAPHLFGRSTGSNLVILAFSSACGHSRAVADQWRDWLQEDRDLRVLAVTNDSEDLGSATTRKDEIGNPKRESLLGGADASQVRFRRRPRASDPLPPPRRAPCPAPITHQSPRPASY